MCDTKDRKPSFYRDSTTSSFRLKYKKKKKKLRSQFNKSLTCVFFLSFSSFFRHKLASADMLVIFIFQWSADFKRTPKGDVIIINFVAKNFFRGNCGCCKAYSWTSECFYVENVRNDYCVYTFKDMQMRTITKLWWKVFWCLIMWEILVFVMQKCESY